MTLSHRKEPTSRDILLRIAGNRVCFLEEKRYTNINVMYNYLNVYITFRCILKRCSEDTEYVIAAKSEAVNRVSFIIFWIFTSDLLNNYLKCT